MGLDSCIYIKSLTDSPHLECALPDKFRIEKSNIGPLGATHEVCNIERYYEEDYARGPWPVLCSCLMVLMNSKDIAAVWYFGGYNDDNWKEPITCDRLINITRYFISHGRSYYGVRVIAESNSLNMPPDSIQLPIDGNKP